MRAVRPFLFGGGYLRSFQRQRVSPAPDGASCENHPRIRPYLVVAPLLGHRFATRYRSGDIHRARRFGLAIAPQQRLYNHHSRAEGLVREKSQLGG